MSLTYVHLSLVKCSQGRVRTWHGCSYIRTRIVVVELVYLLVAVFVAWVVCCTTSTAVHLKVWCVELCEIA